MAKDANNEAAMPNSALETLSILVGEWTMAGTHPSIPDTLHGHTSFKWLEGGAFLGMYSDTKETVVPSSIAMIGSDDVLETYFMLYFDKRGVSRKYEMTLRDNIWTLWRDAPKFSQR